MDRLSAFLMACIIVIVGINGIIIYNTWLAVENCPQVVESADGSMDIEHVLIFNDDTSITNNADGSLWLRVKVVSVKPYGSEDYEVISSAEAAGYWEKTEDGWYYYREPVASGEITRPLVDSLLYKGEESEGEPSGKFRLKVEAVDESWLSEIPESSREAFKIFETGYSEYSTGAHL